MSDFKGMLFNTFNDPLVLIDYDVGQMWNNFIPNKHVDIELTPSDLSINVTVTNITPKYLNKTPGIIFPNMCLFPNCTYKLTANGSDGNTNGRILLYAGSRDNGLIYNKLQGSFNASDDELSFEFTPTHSLTDVGVLIRDAVVDDYFELTHIKLEKIENSNIDKNLVYNYSNYVTLDTHQRVYEDKIFTCKIDLVGNLNINSQSNTSDPYDELYNSDASNNEIYLNTNPISNDIHIGHEENDLNIYSKVRILNTTESSDYNSGALVVSGGVGVHKELKVNGNIKTNTDIYQRDSILLPPGVIMPYAGASAPSGYVLCNGASYNTSDIIYTRLYNVIGYTYGGSDTNFNVPDLQNRIPFGQGSGTVAVLGGTGGFENKTLSEAEMPSHNHSGTTSGLSLNYVSVLDNEPLSGINVVESSNNVYPNLNIDNTGSDVAFSLLNPYIVLNYIIKL